MRSVPLWIAAAWWGSLTTLGFFVVPMLFAHLPTPAMAGAMAARLFSVQTAISAVSGLVLLMLFRSNRSLAPEGIAQSATLFVVGGVLLALLVEFGVAPHIIARDNLALWHGVGTAMYVVQWLCAGVVFGKLSVHRGA
ncbi:MAG: DUF4149 domain-containing protein [Rhodoferax sp.]|nr:DUF4149 domain-containing protein [Rhodoferax sp.]